MHAYISMFKSLFGSLKANKSSDNANTATTVDHSTVTLEKISDQVER